MSALMQICLVFEAQRGKTHVRAVQCVLLEAEAHLTGSSRALNQAVCQVLASAVPMHLHQALNLYTAAWTVSPLQGFEFYSYKIHKRRLKRELCLKILYF